MSNEGQFSGKVALVTGGGSGIGKAAAIELGRQGASVAVLSRKQGRIDETCADVIEAGGQALGISADVTNEAEMTDAIRQIDERWGRLDSVVVNAGANGVWTSIEELTLEEWNWTINTNLTSTFLTTKVSLPLLKRQGGAIVITASVNGSRIFSNTGASAYSSSKAGQVAFAKMAALELAPDKVRVNVVCPGWITTNINEATELRNVDKIRWPRDYPKGFSPLAQGPGDPAQVARVMAFLLSDAADHVSGTEMWVDGTESLLLG
jgi:NAD(P)-dependent dehydrogenase (short-subunit alcohol dehydrogenase family)